MGGINRLKLFDLQPKEDPDDLFGREAEINQLINLIKAKRWTVILGPRMVGKSSLMKVACTALHLEDYHAIYVNLWATKDVQGLLNRLIQGITDSKGLYTKVKDSFETLELSLKGPSARFAKQPMQTVTDIFATVGRTKEKCVIALDEVHTLANISGPLQASLATIFNTYTNVTFMFSGSMFGLIKAMLKPRPTSPLYGRSPAEIYLKPFDKKTSAAFLDCGFKEENIIVEIEQINETVEKLDGIPGWLTRYGNNRTLLQQAHKDALETTITEASRITRHELENFLSGRERRTYIAVLKSTTVASRWSEIKEQVENRLGKQINNERLSETLKNLEGALIIEKKEGVYKIVDPILTHLLLTARIT